MGKPSDRRYSARRLGKRERARRKNNRAVYAGCVPGGDWTHAKVGQKKANAFWRVLWARFDACPSSGEPDKPESAPTDLDGQATGSPVRLGAPALAAVGGNLAEDGSDEAGGGRGAERQGDGDGGARGTAAAAAQGEWVTVSKWGGTDQHGRA